jgi:hypothetical protein
MIRRKWPGVSQKAQLELGSVQAMWTTREGVVWEAKFICQDMDKRGTRRRERAGFGERLAPCFQGACRRSIYVYLIKEATRRVALQPV